MTTPETPALKAHVLRLRLDLLRASSRQTNDRAILRQEELRELRRTPEGMAKWRRIRYSADARIAAYQREAAAIIEEIARLEGVLAADIAPQL